VGAADLEVEVAVGHGVSLKALNVSRIQRASGSRRRSGRCITMPFLLIYASPSSVTFATSHSSVSLPTTRFSGLESLTSAIWSAHALALLLATRHLRPHSLPARHAERVGVEHLGPAGEAGRHGHQRRPVPSAEVPGLHDGRVPAGRAALHGVSFPAIRAFHAVSAR